MNLTALLPRIMLSRIMLPRIIAAFAMSLCGLLLIACSQQSERSQGGPAQNASSNQQAADESATASLLIRNVRLADGTGAALQPGAIRIADGKIIEIGPALVPKTGETVRDGKGLVLAPGFIDSHSHHDEGLFEQPGADALVSQGITTIVVGQDGGSAFPLTKLWNQLQAQPVAVNVASYSGHNTLRSQILGEQDYRRQSSKQEVARIRALLDADMQAGSLGLSTGLGYEPGLYSSPEEVVELAKTVAPYGGRYISHLRSESITLWESIDELVEIGRQAKIPVQLSHAKLAMVSLWGQAPKLLQKLDAARAEGIDATLDIYPYEYWQSTMTVALPERDFNDVKAARFVLANTIKPEGMLFGTYDADPSIVGKTLAEIAAERGRDPAELYLELIRRAIAEDQDESVIGTSMAAEDIVTLMQWPHANICSDGAIAGAHPRGAGAFTRVLGKYVRQDGVLALEDALHKMTGLSAKHLGFRNRGLLKPGLAADLVLLDPARVIDRATTKDPTAVSSGIAAVWVNGELVWDGKQTTGKRPGQPLKRGAG